jgi:hypothetical protein
LALRVPVISSLAGTWSPTSSTLALMV